MKINFESIKAKLISIRRGEYRTISAKAHHDWKIMVVVGMCGIFVAIAGNVYLFFQVDNGTALNDGGVQNQSSDVVSKKNLEDTVLFFKERQARLEDLKTIKPDVVDPSM